MPPPKPEPLDIDKALLDPASVFDTPEDVVARKGLPDTTKIEILRRWEYDIKEVQVAEEEGMQDGGPDMLDRVLRSLHALGTGPDIENSPPTKQGSV